MTHSAASRALEADAVLFDMDGTLVDSNALVTAMWTDFARQHGHNPRDVLEHAHGTPSVSTLRRFLPDGEDLGAWMRRIGEWETGQFGGVVEIDGAAAVVASLPPDRWAVVTSALATAARVRLASVGLPEPRVLVGADQVERGKPHPDPFLDAAAQLGVEASACVVFEDSPAGIVAGLVAGARVVVVGDYAGPQARGLSRIRDWTSVSVRVTPQGRVAFDGIDAPPGD